MLGFNEVAGSRISAARDESSEDQPQEPKGVGAL